MTFSKLRDTISKNSVEVSTTSGYELVRFCNKKYTSIPGIANKLFKTFINDHQPDVVVSFSDRAHTKGKLYSILGFEGISKSGPNYVWVRSNTDIAYHRINAQKRNIRRFLNDTSIDLSKTEREIMIERGFVQVYDSGTVKWVWKKNPSLL